MSRITGKTVRKSPEARRTEIIRAASLIALDEGVEKITVRSVAKKLGVQPGLISHYFPSVEELIIAALGEALTRERTEWIRTEGDALIRMAEVIHRTRLDTSVLQARLWLNARNYSRFSPRIADELSRQEELDRRQLTQLIEAGVSQGKFKTLDPEFACIRILIAIDGVSAYANSVQPFAHDAYEYFVVDVAEAELNINSGSLRAVYDDLVQRDSDLLHE